MLRQTNNMNALLRTSLALVLLLPAAGCASRTAPFNELDQAQVTVLKLQGQEAPPTPAPAPVAGGFPFPIPGLTPEMQQQAQQALDQFVQMLPPGMVPPGMIPGQPAQPAQQPQLPRFKGFVILAQTPLTSEPLKEEILDIFGSEDSFQAGKGNCFYPGMGVAFQDPSKPPVELLISLSCNQAMGDGFAWPYPVNGFTPDTAQRLTRVYEQLWGPVPPGGA